MTEFILLEEKTNGLATLKLFNIKEGKGESWLVQFINKRLTTKWFLDYETAKAYYTRKCKTL